MMQAAGGSRVDVAALASLLVDLTVPGIGVDVETVARFATPDPRIFTAAELAYCAGQADPAESRAGRWCAKEAVCKACSNHVQLTLREIEICAGPHGRPMVLLPERATALGLRAEVSIAHTGGVAVAVAVAGIAPVSTDSAGGRSLRVRIPGERGPDGGCQGGRRV